MRSRHLFVTAGLAGALLLSPLAPLAPAVASSPGVWAVFQGIDATGVPGRPDLLFYVSETAPVTFDLAIKDATTGVVETGYGGTVDGVSVDRNRVAVPVDLTGLRTADYLVDGTVTYHDPDAGDLEAAFDEGAFHLDSTAPVIEGVHVSAPTVYPVKDHYLDKVYLYVNASDDEVVDQERLEVRDSHGNTVTVFKPSGNEEKRWDGRDQSGNLVRAGVYTVHTTVTDDAGNTTTDDSTTVRVSHKRLVHKTFTKTVTAKASVLAGSYVGPCSTLRFPSARGWKGSMGLYTDTKCHGTTKRSLVSTVHELRVPAAVTYGPLRVSAYGGAAKAEPRSLAYIRYFDVHRRRWKKDTRMGTHVGNHQGARVHASPFVASNRKVAWGVYTWGGARYDIRGFTLRLAYSVLR